MRFSQAQRRAFPKKTPALQSWQRAAYWRAAPLIPQEQMALRRMRVRPWAAVFYEKKRCSARLEKIVSDMTRIGGRTLNFEEFGDKIKASHAPGSLAS